MYLITDHSIHAWWLIMGGVMGLISGRNESNFQAALGITWPLYHWLPGAFYLGVKWLQLVASAELRVRETLPSVSWCIHGLEYGIDDQSVLLQLYNIPSL